MPRVQRVHSLVFSRLTAIWNSVLMAMVRGTEGEGMKSPFLLVPEAAPVR